MSESRERVPYIDACQAHRQASDRARKANLSGTEWSVFSVVVDQTAAYSKLEDYTYAAAIAQLAGVPGRHAVKRTRRILGKLNRLGIIVWRPGRGAGHRSLIGLLPAGEKAADSDPLSTEKKGVESVPEKRVGSDPPTEKRNRGVPPETSLLSVERFPPAVEIEDDCLVCGQRTRHVRRRDELACSECETAVAV
jgi:hypothetical protein